MRVLERSRPRPDADGYAQLDVLVLPSRTTPTWKEQFGRVIVEALWCGVPVVGSDSGEIPWLIGLTGGGLMFPEGDHAALAGGSTRLRGRPGAARAAGRGAAASGRSGCSRCPPRPIALERLLAGAVGARTALSGAGAGSGGRAAARRT